MHDVHCALRSISSAAHIACLLAAASGCTQELPPPEHLGDAGPEHVWSTRFGGAGRSLARGVASDRQGNVFVTGSFAGTLDLGGGAASLVSQGDTDAFIAKLDADGNPSWGRAFGDAAGQVAWTIDVDDEGNSLVSGHFAGTVDFGEGPRSAGDTDDVFIVKLDPDGRTLWTRQIGDVAEHQVGVSATFDAEGGVLLAGGFQGTIDLGAGPLTSAGDLDILVAKLDPDGNPLWNQTFGGPGREQAIRAAVDEISGEVIIGGLITNTVDFGDGPLPFLTSGAHGFVVLRLDPEGKLLWSRRFGELGAEDLLDVATDGEGNVLVAGSDLGPTLSLDGDTSVPPRNYDIVVAKLSPAGDPLWNERFGGAGRQYVSGLAVDVAGHVIVAGGAGGAIDFGGGPLAGSDSPQPRLVLAELNPEGRHLWSSRASGDPTHRASDVALDPAGNLLLCGDGNGTIDLGGGPLQGVAEGRMVLAKLAR
ncbi:SBBP repeat-containing protein [Sorangium sp. So ce269]